MICVVNASRNAGWDYSTFPQFHNCLPGLYSPGRNYATNLFCIDCLGELQQDATSKIAFPIVVQVLYTRMCLAQNKHSA